MPGGIKYSLIKVKAGKTKKTNTITKGKIRVGIIIGPKNCDPILPGTQVSGYPKSLRVKNNFGPNASGWGGQYQVDTQLGLKLQRTYPHLFVADIIPGSQITPVRLSSNHVNLNLGYDMVNAFMSEDKKHEALVKKAFTMQESRLWPEWDLQDWIYCKERYLGACEKAGVSIADTIFISGGIQPEALLKKVKAKGWERFFIKPAHMCSFGASGGKFSTKECLADKSILRKYQKEEAKVYKHFLVQPYILKPNGQVFDEVRNWFIDGKWSYAIFTHGTDDNAVFPLRAGGKNAHLIEPCRRVAEAAYKEVLKVAKWRGKTMAPPMTRIDIGVVPVQGSKTKVKTFVNEIESEAATWLVRYVPFDIVKHMVTVYPRKIQEFIHGLKPGEKRPDVEAMQKLEVVVKDLAEKERPNVATKRKRISAQSTERTIDKIAKRARASGA
jgi:hypothetical protein